MSEFETHEGLPREAEVLRARRESLERLREAGIEPFAMGFDVNAHAADLLAEFEDRLENEEESDRRASVAGRVVLARRHGRLTFLVIRDRTGDLQLFCEDATLGDGYGLLEEIDLGDIVGATGHVVRTRRGELSLKVDSLTMLTKALRPLPEKWHGLQDPDLQQRRRYLHLITDPTAREYVSARATVLRTIRRELDDRGYTEVETPVLQAVAGGALAKPFTTHHNALDTDLKLRISLELYLKRLLVGRPRAHLRDRPELPQRRHRPGAQPGIHHARAVRGVRRLRDDDAHRRGPDPGERAGGQGLAHLHVPRARAGPHAALPPGHGAGGRLRGYG